MRLSAKAVVVAGVLFFLVAASGWAQPTISGRLRTAVEKTEPTESLSVLVYFADKGFLNKGALNEALEIRQQQFTSRALKRRAKMGLTGMTFEDLPVCSEYVNRIKKLGATHRHSLNWFNAASFEMTKAQIKACSGFGFIKMIDLLPARRKTPPPVPRPTGQKMSGPENPKAHLLNYGPSFTQDSLINAVVCHDSGYSGAGVLVAMFDNGFRKGHQAFDSIRADGRLLDEWDFVTNADTVTWDSHGTGTWSEAGGYVPGQLIGPAYKASWAIYHTEDMSQEMPVEEDHWAAALQRSDSIGTDVVSSSLGYRDFDSTQYSYTYEDLDGNTAISSMAARHASSLGIIVCNAMANSGPSLGSLTAPADADSILSVGNVDSFGIINPSSSRGPTYDYRPKPEVCAQGTNIYWASWLTTTSYIHYATGTSCATPLVAGACALVLEAHPEWTPMQVREALMMTASRSASPDSTTYGWGVINVWAAIHYSPSGTALQKQDAIADPSLKLSCRPNPARSTASISFIMFKGGSAILTIYDISGRLVYKQKAKDLPLGRNEFKWDCHSISGGHAPNGVYFCKVSGAEQKEVAARLVILR